MNGDQCMINAEYIRDSASRKDILGVGGFFFIEIRLDFPHPLDPNTICKKTTTKQSVLLQRIVSDWIEFILCRRVVLERERVETEISIYHIPIQLYIQ